MKCDPRTRVAIVGTAASWRQCPWNDPGLFVMSLNDAYTLGLPRADAWWDLHPFDHMYFRPLSQKVVHADDIPPGFYVRPEGHLDRLKDMARSIPVFLQHDPPAGWPAHAQRFPLEAYSAKYASLGMDANGKVIPHPYWASGPAPMVAWAIEQGAEEIQVWGIHLATEHEYREQRPNFERLLGIAEGKGIRVLMAESSPVMKHGWQYAFESKPRPHPAMERLQRLQQERATLTKRLAVTPRFRSKAGALDRLQRIVALEQDCQQALLHQHLAAPIVVPVIGGVHA